MSQALSETIRTIRVGITGTSATESYTLAPGLAQYVESVYVEVTNNAASAVHPVLSISEQAGVVIAKRRQGGTIAASGSGSATWALRLSGDDTGDTGLTGIFYDTVNTGDWLYVASTGNGGPFNEGIAFNASQNFEADANNVFLFALGALANATLHSDHTLDLVAGGTMNQTAAANWNVSADIWQGGANTVQLGAAAGGWTITTQNSDAFYAIDTANHKFIVQIPTGGALEVRNHSGAPIFRVNENGDLQGLTGKTLTFNL